MEISKEFKRVRERTVRQRHTGKPLPNYGYVLGDPASVAEVKSIRKEARS